jgi:hypothetical protein
MSEFMGLVFKKKVPSAAKLEFGVFSKPGEDCFLMKHRCQS